MGNDDAVEILGSAMREYNAKLTIEKKADIWMYWHGNRLLMTLNEMTAGSSMIEALAFASGALNWSASTLKIDDGFAAELAEKAREEPDAYDLAMKVCASNIMNKGSLSEPLRNLGASVLSGTQSRPSKEGRPRSNNWNRDVLILRAVMAAELYGIPVSNAGESNNTCAASLVADIFGKAGQHIVTKETVLHVSKRRDKSGLDEEIRRIDFAAYKYQTGRDL